MTFLPIIARELKIAAKRPMTYGFRCIAAMLAIAVTLGLTYGTLFGSIAPGALGRNVLLWLGIIGFLYATVEGALITCDCLTEEKRSGTLGLLFLTDLGGYDIVLGKVFARSWHAFGAILAAVPAPAITFLIGGVKFGDLWRLIAALLALLLFSASVGVFFSACCRSGARSMLASIAAVTIPWIALALYEWSAGPWWTTGFNVIWCLLSTPAVMFTCALASFDTTAGTITAKLSWLNSFWLTFLLTNVLSMIVLGAASWILPRSWQEKEFKEPRAPLFERLREKLGLARFDHPFKPRTIFGSLLSVDPSLWIAERRHGSAFAFWGIFQVLLLTGVWTLSHYDPAISVWMLVLTAIVAHYGIKVRVAMQACRAFSEDRRTGGLELLLTTGLEVDEIVSGHILALKRQFLAPTLAILAIDLALIVSVAFNISPWETVILSAGIVLVAVSQIADMHALAWLGLWQGLNAAHFTNALRRTLLHAVVGQVSWLGTFVVAAGCVTGRPEPIPFALVFMLLGCAMNVSYCCHAYTKLHDNFRSISAEIVAPQAPSRGWWPFRQRKSGPAITPQTMV